jgi:hypothetical protein
VTSDKRGWGYAHIWEMGVSIALYGDAATPRVFGVTKMSPSLLLTPLCSEPFPMMLLKAALFVLPDNHLSWQLTKR